MFVLTARNAVSGGKIICKRVCLLLIHSVNHWTKQCTFPHENVSLPDTFFTCTNLTLNAVFLHKRVVLWCSLCYSFWPFIFFFFWLTLVSLFYQFLRSYERFGLVLWRLYLGRICLCYVFLIGIGFFYSLLKIKIVQKTVQEKTTPH